MRWELKLLGPFVDILSGFAFKSKNFNDEGVGLPIIRVRDVGKEKSSTFYDGEFHERYIIKRGDLLVAMDGEFRVRKWIGPNSLLNQRVCKIEPRDKIELEFLKYFLSILLKKVEDKTSFATVKHLSVKKINNLKIPLPPLPIQKKIAGLLDRADALRRKTQAQIEALDELGKAVFLEMFGDPVRNEKGWEVKELQSLTNKFSDGPFGSNLKTSHYTERGIRVIRLNNIGVGEFINDNKAYISTEHYENVLKKHTCIKGDVLFGTLGVPNLRACKFPGFLEFAVNKADCLQFRPDPEKINDTFLVYMINSQGIQAYVKNLVHGQTRGRISKGQLTNVKIPVPSLSLQSHFATIIQNIESQKSQLKRALQESEDLFNGLLQEVFG